MQRDDAASPRPSITNLSIVDLAAFDEESLLRHFVDMSQDMPNESGQSREQMAQGFSQQFSQQWGSVNGFLEYCRKEKAELEKYTRGSVPMLRLGVSPCHRMPMSTG